MSGKENNQGEKRVALASALSGTLLNMGQTFILLFGRLCRFNHSVAAKFRTSARRVLQLEAGALVALGFTLTQVDEYAGAIVCWLLFTFIWAFSWKWADKHPRFRTLLRVGHVLLAVMGCVLLVVWTNIKRGDKDWSNFEKLSKHKPEQRIPQGTQTSPIARIRILDVVPVPMSKSGAPFPALNIYYDVVGTGMVTGVVSRFGAGFGGQISDEAVIAEQDKLFQWDGWKGEMARRRQFEMHVGDPGEFTSIPNMEGKLAEEFRANWVKVNAGTIVLHVLITFKFLEPSGRVGVSENCFWFSGGFARHLCGRGRTFEEQQ